MEPEEEPMAYSLFSSNNGKWYDASQLVHDIEYTTSLESQPGKLTFMVEKDPTGKYQVSIGSVVRFYSDKRLVFEGKVFTVETDRTDVYRITAYDALRYLKNSNCILVENMSLNDLFAKIINAYGLKGTTTKWIYEQLKSSTVPPLETHNFWDKTCFDILDYYMSSVGTKLYANSVAPLKGENSTANVISRLYLRCKGETIQMRELRYDFWYNEDGTPRTKFLKIGDGSLLTDYNYKVDIDNDVYNRFMFVYNNKDATSEGSDETHEQVQKKQLFAGIDSGHIVTNTNTSLDGKAIGENTIPKWGVLCKVIEVNTLEYPNLIAEYMKAAVEFYNQPSRTLKIDALGYDGVYAGSGFFLELSKLGVTMPVYVVSATHRYNADEHTMELEVSTNKDMRAFL